MAAFHSDNTVSTKSALALNENDISEAHLSWTNALNHQRVAGQDAGKHAPASGGKTESSKGAQNLACKFALQGGGSVNRSLSCLPHDTFALSPWQLESTGLTLPQLRAEVTKTWSKRKLGFS